LKPCKVAAPKDNLYATLCDTMSTSPTTEYWCGSGKKVNISLQQKTLNKMPPLSCNAEVLTFEISRRIGGVFQPAELISDPYLQPAPATSASSYRLVCGYL
jgi:hypothetical protein